ncbi:MAG TPA: hypothetical protein DIC35_02305 [Candidatus Moranbacteria bacterium]|nr:hypothetical protein [Candidatus Moranbacteria bacterium]
MKKKNIALIGLGILAAAGLYYQYDSNKSENGEVQYVTEKAAKGMMISSVSASGNIIVDQIANIDPTISGTVQDLSVQVGDRVKKGQFLFSIENDDLGVGVDKALASLEQAKNSIDSAELDVKGAKADYDKAKDDDSYTKKQRSVLKDKIDIARAKIIASEKSYEAALSDYRNQKKDADRRKVLAAIDGTVNAVNIKNGDDLGKNSTNSPSETPIIIGDLKTLKAEVQVNEVDIAKVKNGQKVMLSLSAIDGLEITGKIEKIDALGTENSGVITYDVTVALDSLDERIRPAMSVSASIITDTKQDIITVSNSAIKTEAGKSFVSVLNQGAPKRKEVEIGAANSSSTEIIKGITEGDEVISQMISSDSSAASSAVKGNGNVRMRGGSGIPGL